MSKDTYTVQINQYRCHNGKISSWNEVEGVTFNSIYIGQKPLGYLPDLIIQERNNYNGIPTVKMNVMVRKNGKLVSYKELKDIYPSAYDKILSLRNTHWS